MFLGIFFQYKNVHPPEKMCRFSGRSTSHGVWGAFVADCGEAIQLGVATTDYTPSTGWSTPLHVLID
jgi:hypothetical protein